MNDVTREVGAALGIAALGSIMATRFHSAMTAPTASLPHDVQDVARQSVGQALAVAQQIGGDAGAELASSARPVHGRHRPRVHRRRLVMAVAGYFFGRLMPNSLPSRIIPSAVEEKASLPLDAS